MLQFMEISELNNDQARVIREKGWCVYTEGDEGGSYYDKGFHWVNRIGYIILSDEVAVEHLDSYEELLKIATYSDEFDKEVRSVLTPIEDKCYVFLVHNPAHYRFEPVWTNKGLDAAKELAKMRFRGLRPQYYNSADYDKMHRIIKTHNDKVKKSTEEALNLLNENGFKVVSSSFAVLNV